MKAEPVIQVEDGKWYAVAFGKKPFLEECCDCCLTHRVEYRVRDGKFWVRYFRDDRRTRLARKARGVKV